MKTSEDHLGSKTCADTLTGSHPQFHEGFHPKLGQHGLVSVLPGRVGGDEPAVKTWRELGGDEGCDAGGQPVQDDGGPGLGGP